MTYWGLRLQPKYFLGGEGTQFDISRSNSFQVLQGKMEAFVQFHSEIRAQSPPSWLGSLSVPGAPASATCQRHVHSE